MLSAGNKLSAHMALIFISVIFALFNVASKQLMSEGVVDQFELVFIRLVLSAVVVAVIEFGFLRTRFASLEDLLKVLGLGMVGVLFVQTSSIFGLKFSTVFHSSLIVSTIPIITIILGMLFYREGVRWQKMAGIATAFLGVAYLLFAQTGHGGASDQILLGDFLLFLNAAGYSWFLIESRGLLTRYNPFSVMAYWYMISATCYAALFYGSGLMGYRDLLSDLRLDFLFELSAWNWMLVGFIVLFGSIMAYTLSNYALSRTTPDVVAIYVFVQPLIGILFGVVFLNETVTWQMAMSGLVILTGVMMTTTGFDTRRLMVRTFSLGAALKFGKRKAVIGIEAAPEHTDYPLEFQAEYSPVAAVIPHEAPVKRRRLINFR